MLNQCESAQAAGASRISWTNQSKMSMIGTVSFIFDGLYIHQPIIKIKYKSLTSKKIVGSGGRSKPASWVSDATSLNHPKKIKWVGTGPKFNHKTKPWGKCPQWTYHIVSPGACPCANDLYKIKYFSVWSYSYACTSRVFLSGSWSYQGVWIVQWPFSPTDRDRISSIRQRRAGPSKQRPTWLYTECLHL